MNRMAIFRQFSPARQLVLLITIWFILLLITLAISTVTGKLVWGYSLSELNLAPDIFNPHYLSYLRFVQILSQVGTFILPVLALAWFVSPEPGSWLTVNRGTSGLALMTGILLILISMPLIDLMGSWNMSLQLPEHWAITARMKGMETSNNQVTEAFMDQTGALQVFSNLMMIGLLAALGEELLFRVALIRILASWMGRFRSGIHLAVIISAFCFAFMHMQFFTFLPRFALGLMLGYLFVWSGSVWLPFIVHLVNNSFIVVAYYLFNTGNSTYDPAILGQIDSPLVYIVSISGVVFMLFYIHSRARRSGRGDWERELRGLPAES